MTYPLVTTEVIVFETSNIKVTNDNLVFRLIDKKNRILSYSSDLNQDPKLWAKRSLRSLIKRRVEKIKSLDNTIMKLSEETKRYVDINNLI